MGKYSEEEKEEVKKGIEAEREIAVYKRLQILMWVMNGKAIEEVAEISGRCAKTVKNIRKAYDGYGVKGSRSKHKGRIGQLTFEQEKEALDKLAEKAGDGQYLRMADLQADFESTTNARYTVPCFYHLLERHDWRKIMPRRRRPKAADEATCEASKKSTLNSAN